MNGTERREQILSILKNSEKPVPGVELARILHVSRQVIVQDMALLRANGVEILSTNRGYVTAEEHSCSRVFKVIHTEKQVEEESVCGLWREGGGCIRIPQGLRCHPGRYEYQIQNGCKAVSAGYF